MASSANLLQITTKPIELQISTQRASLESPRIRMPKQNVQVNRPGVRMESRAAKLNIDTYAARSSMGIGSMKSIDFMREEAQRGWNLSREGTERIVENGNSLARGSSPVDIAVQNNRAGFTIETFVEFIPKTGPEFSVEEGMLDIDIGANEVGIDWELSLFDEVIYHPAVFDVVVAQYPEVIIEFIGDPLYFPPSANPNYVPVIDFMV